MGIKEDIDQLLNYLSDEDKSFWENCTCNDEIQNRQFPHLCTCPENKHHILRTINRVQDWLDSPSCPLVDEGEE